MIARSSAPLSVPMAVPRPPDRLAPPMITAAKTGNRSDRPAFGWVDPMNAKSRIAAERGEAWRTVMNAANLYLRTGRRASSAAARVAADGLEPESEQGPAEQEPDDDGDRRSSTAPCIGNPNGRSCWLRQAEEPVDLALGRRPCRSVGRRG